MSESTEQPQSLTAEEEAQWRIEFAPPHPAGVVIDRIWATLDRERAQSAVLRETLAYFVSKYGRYSTATGKPVDLDTARGVEALSTEAGAAFLAENSRNAEELKLLRAFRIAARESIFSDMAKDYPHADYKYIATCRDKMISAYDDYVDWLEAPDRGSEPTEYPKELPDGD